jgi:uncharacterized protein (TIGR02996 family)
MNEKLREALEAAIVENPDDLAAHMAYADLLSDAGDPRGEFIQVQLALENGRLPPQERQELKQREQDLLTGHQDEWLGELAGPLLDPEAGPWGEEAQFTLGYRRGWLDSLELGRGINLNLTEALAEAPEVRLLRRLAILDDPYVAPDEEDADREGPARFPVLVPLARSPYFGNVRVLALGDPSGSDDDERTYYCGFSGHAAAGVVKRMPCLEELYLWAHEADTNRIFRLSTLEHLRILQVDHNFSYPLGRLAANPALSRLTHLLCHPHAYIGETQPGAYITLEGLRAVARSPHMTSLTHLRLRMANFGDEGVREIIDSGLLGRLKVLDLRHGLVSDAGARALAECPALRQLELLDIEGNTLSDRGIAALRRALGVNLLAEPQGTGEHYRYQGDME